MPRPRFFIFKGSILLKSLLLIPCFFIQGQAQVVTRPEDNQSVSVERWDYLEIELKGPSTGNPFLDVRLDATFTDGKETIKTAGFYDGNGTYRIRFMPPETGHWTYETFSNSWDLTGRLGAFDVTPATGKNHGPVRVHSTYHFAYEDGTPYQPFGTTTYNWLDTPEDWQELTLQTLAKSPFNKLRMLVTPQKNPFRGTFAPPRWPYEGQPPREWDLNRFNVDFFQHYEKRLLDLRNLGIEADVILFHPYGKPWGFNSMNREQDDRYLRYIVARFSALRNVWWSLANEYDFIRTKTEDDWDHYFQLIQSIDPYGHLRSIHNGKLIYNHTHPWVTHASIQHQSAPLNPATAELFRDAYRKPIVYDEVEYEGNSESRWGQLSPEEMVHRFWSGMIAGTYVGHGDIYPSPDHDAWIGFGGKIIGRSEPRIAFLRSIVEAGPKDGLEPVDKWWNPNVAGIGGSYYLIYLGHETPSAWPFRLFRTGVEEGQHYRAEVIDTWNMTITPIQGDFVTMKENNNYYYTDVSGRSVPLPSRPGMALRITRLPSPALIQD